MCRSILTLSNLAPPATSAEANAAALQYVRKITGARTPSRANAQAFDVAVSAVAAATEALLAGLVTSASPRTREAAAAQARARAAARAAAATPAALAPVRA